MVLEYEYKISFVLPIYNVELYIERCLQSIFQQDFDEDDFEVIVVDDKGHDSSMTIVNKWAVEHPNITILDHIINKGLGAARNSGLNKAKGKYVWFIDSDDYIRAGCLKNMIFLLESNNLDVITFNFSRQNYLDEYDIDTVNPTYETEVIMGKYFIEQYFQPTVMSAWSKIYKTDFLLKNDFNFNEGVFWEDADIVLKILYSASRIKFIPEHNYFYCLNEQSISRTNHWKKTADMIKMGYRKVSFAKNIFNDSPNLSVQIEKDGIWNATAIRKIVFYSPEERKLFYNEINGDMKNEFALKSRSFIVKILYSYPFLCQIILSVLSPVLKCIKYIK